MKRKSDPETTYLNQLISFDSNESYSEKRSCFDIELWCKCNVFYSASKIETVLRVKYSISGRINFGSMLFPGFEYYSSLSLLNTGTKLKDLLFVHFFSVLFENVFRKGDGKYEVFSCLKNNNGGTGLQYLKLSNSSHISVLLDLLLSVV